MAHTELELRKRRAIEGMLNAKVPASKIAAEIGRNRSTVYREIKRNFWTDDAFAKEYACYFGHAAHLQTDRRRSVRRKLIRFRELTSQFSALFDQSMNGVLHGCIVDSRMRIVGALAA